MSAIIMYKNVTVYSVSGNIKISNAGIKQRKWDFFCRNEDTMYSQIEQILLQYGYENIFLNTADIHLALRQEGEEGYAVVTIDETNGNYLTAEQFYHVSEQIRVFLQKRGCYHCHFLYLLVSEGDSSARRLFQHYECFWRIVPSRGQVMVFEEVEDVFMVLRRPLENLLEQRNVWRESDAAPQRGAERFKTAVHEKRIPWCNLFIILLNFLIFLYTDFFAVFSNSGIVEGGALGWHEVLEQGQWYRLLTSMFLHSNIEHIFNNMLVLFFIGSNLELELGRWRYGILYLGSGVLAGCTSMVYNMLRNDYVVSIGASGAIFGTVGAMLYLVLFHKGKRAKYNVRQIAWMAFLSLYGGFTSQGVDNAAHFGGFLAGFLLAGLLTLYQKKGGKHDYA